MPVPLFRYPVVPLVLQITAPPQVPALAPNVIILAARACGMATADSNRIAKAIPIVLFRWLKGPFAGVSTLLDSSIACISPVIMASQPVMLRSLGTGSPFGGAR